MDCSLPDISIHGISQGRILEWVAISFSKIGQIKLSSLRSRKKKKKRKMSLRNLLAAIKCTHMYIMGDPEGEEKEKGVERIFEEIMLPNYPKLIKDLLCTKDLQ